MPRNIGSVTDAILTANEIEYWNFVSITLPSPVGIQRFTDRPYGFVGNIDGSSQTWPEADFDIGPITQSRQQTLQVNWVKFANLDYTWTNWAYTPGLRDCLVIFYAGWWNVSVEPAVFVGAYPIYEGLTDDVQLNQVAQLALRPHSSPWNYRVPPQKRSGKCINVYRNMEDCQYTGAEPAGESTCAKTRTACAARGNTININIYDDAPKINETISWGGVTRRTTS